MSDPPSEDGRRSRSDAASRLAALLADVAENQAPAPETTEPGPAPTGADAHEPDAEAQAPEADDAEAGARTEAFDLRSLDRLLAEAGDPALDRPDAPVDLPALPPTARERGAGSAGDVLPPLPSLPRPARTDDADEAPAAEVPPAAPTVRVPPPLPAPPVAVPALDEDDAPPPADDPPVAGTASEPPVPLRRLTLRAAAFGTAFLLLVAAIPVLGLAGARRLETSQGGTFDEQTDQPTEEGYRALVTPTPTALVVHRDAEGVPRSATLLALGAGTTGGTVLQVPLSTKVRVQRFYVDRLSVAYSAAEDIDLFFREVEDRLGVAIDERIDLTDGQLAELVAPVAPLTVDSPDAVLTDDGHEFPAGEIALAAADVGPYLRGNAGEDELARLVRNEAVWAAWLGAVGTGDQAVSSATTTGIGPFLRTLADGTAADPVTTRVETLDVGPPLSSPLEEPALEPEAGFNAQVIDAVPFPLSPRLGRRYALKLLNGVDGTALPEALMHDLMLAGASLSQLGNADEFGHETTTIEISGRPWQEAAEAARFVLGDSAEITTMTKARADTEDADIVITIGADVLDRLEEEGDGG